MPVNLNSPTSTSLNSSTSISLNSSTPISYTVLNIDLNNKRAFNVSIRISEKLSDDYLKYIAQRVKEDINADSNIPERS